MHQPSTMGSGSSSPVRTVVVQSAGSENQIGLINNNNMHSSDKTPLLTEHSRTMHDDKVKMTYEVQTSMSDFSTFTSTSEGVGAPVQPHREVPSCSQGVQTDPWEPSTTLAGQTQQAVDYQRTSVSKEGVALDDIWVQVDGTCESNANPNLVVKRSGWKTVRIFVSSTFKDFHYEREVLVKEVNNSIFSNVLIDFKLAVRFSGSLKR